MLERMNAVWRSFALSALVAIAGCGEADAQGGWGSNRLCAHPYNFQPGSNGVIYTANTIVQQLQSKYSKTLTLDRYPIRRQLDPIYATYAQ